MMTTAKRRAPSHSSIWAGGLDRLPLVFGVLSLLCVAVLNASAQQPKAKVELHNFVVGRVGDTVDAKIGFHDGQLYSFITLSATDPVRPIDHTMPLILNKAGGWPEWIYVEQRRGPNSQARRFGIPLVNIHLYTRRLYSLQDHEVDPSSINHFFASGLVSVGQGGEYGKFRLNIDVRMNWFVYIDPGNMFQIPQQRKAGEPVAIADKLRIRVRLGGSHDRLGETDRRFLEQWPVWADVVMSNVDDLVVFDPAETRPNREGVYTLAFTRHPNVGPTTQLRRTITLNVVVNDKLPSWRGKVLGTHVFRNIVDADGIAGTEALPTDTPAEEEPRKPLLISTHTPTHTETPSLSPATATPSRTPLPHGPTPTLADIRLGRTIRFRLGEETLQPSAAAQLSADAAETELLLLLPNAVRRNEEPLIIRTQPPWLEPLRIEYEGERPETTRARLRLRPRLDEAALAALEFGADTLAGQLVIAPAGLVIPIDESRLDLQLTGLQWQLRLSQTRLDFSQRDSPIVSLQASLSCNGVEVAFPEDVTLALVADQANPWAERVLRLQQPSIDGSHAAFQLAFEAEHWPASSRTALMFVEARVGEACVRQSLSLRFEPPPREVAVLPLPLNMVLLGAGGALATLAVVLGAAGLLRGRGAVRASRVQEAGSTSDAAVFGDPFSDLPPEEEDELPAPRGEQPEPAPAEQDAAARSAWAMANDNPFASWSGPIVRRAVGEPAKPALTVAPSASAVAPPAVDAVDSAPSHPLLHELRRALQALDPELGERDMSPSHLDQLAEQLFQRMRPLVERPAGSEVPAGAPAAAASDLAHLREQLAALAPQVAALSGRVDKLEQSLAAQGGSVAPELAADLEAARELAKNFEQRVQRALQISQPMQTVWDELAALRQQVTTGAAKPAGDNLAEQLAHLSEELHAHFCQQIRFQGRLVLGTLPEQLDWQAALVHLDRFTSRPRLKEMQQKLEARVEVAVAVMHVLTEFVVTDDTPNAELFRSTWASVLATGYPNAVQGGDEAQAILQHGVRTLREICERLRLPVAAHQSRPRQEYDDQWLAGEALRLLRAAIDSWLA